jgi:hypothetical protein
MFRVLRHLVLSLGLTWALNAFLFIEALVEIAFSVTVRVIISRETRSFAVPGTRKRVSELVWDFDALKNVILHAAEEVHLRVPCKAWWCERTLVDDDGLAHDGVAKATLIIRESQLPLLLVLDDVRVLGSGSMLLRGAGSTRATIDCPSTPVVRGKVEWFGVVRRLSGSRRRRMKRSLELRVVRTAQRCLGA